jgi:hypothetical protein
MRRIEPIAQNIEKGKQAFARCFPGFRYHF